MRIVGLAEDAARFYEPSQTEAARLLGSDFPVPAQKDVWHGLDKAAQTVTDLERLALRQLARAKQMGQTLAKQPWNETAFNAWTELDENGDGSLHCDIYEIFVGP